VSLTMKVFGFARLTTQQEAICSPGRHRTEPD